MTRAPRLLRWLLGQCVRPADRNDFLADIDDGHARRVAAGGALSAWRWMLLQCVTSPWPLLRLRWRMGRASHPERDRVWHDLADDVRLTLRLARRNRLTTAAVIATMVLGVSVTTAVFSVVNGVLLRPLAFRDSERVQQFGATMRSGDSTMQISWPDFQDFRREARAFSDVAAASLSGVALTHGDAPQHVLAGNVDAAYPRVFSTSMQRGRYFGADELRAGGRHVVILTDALWTRAFGRAPDIVGRSISIGGDPHEVVGVLAAEAYLWPSASIELLAPLIVLSGTFQENRGASWLYAAGKVRAGTSLATSRREVTAIDARLIQAYPAAKEGLAVWVAPLRDMVVGDVRSMLILLSAAVAALLLIVCVNVANVLLVQSSARSREFALRTALGGSRMRIRRQLLTEGLLLSIVGGAVGVALAPSLTRVFVALYPGTLPRGGEARVDLTVLLVAFACTLLAGVLSALPTMRSAGRAVGQDLTSGGRSSAGLRERHLARGLLVAQVALSLTLLFASGLLVQTFQQVSATAPGFRSSGLLSFHVSPNRVSHPDAAALTRFYRLVVDAVGSIPGVTHVATSNEVPFSGYARFDVFVPVERGDRGSENPQVRIGTVSADYFTTLGLPILAGRGFARTDADSSPRVVVINDALRRKYYADVDPVGRMIAYDRGAPWQIVGVVGSARMRGLTQPEEPELFVPDAQLPGRSRYIMARVAMTPSQVVPQVRAAMAQLDPMLPMTEVATVEERMERDLAPQRYRASLVGSLGTVALLLVTLGIYGVVAYGVTRQAREIGIRMALGERRGQVWGRIVGGAIQVAVIGVALGLGLSLAMERWLASVVVGVRPDDPITLAAVSFGLVVVAAAAAAGPARRATKVDPVTALRAD